MEGLRAPPEVVKAFDAFCAQLHGKLPPGSQIALAINSGFEDNTPGFHLIYREEQPAMVRIVERRGGLSRNRSLSRSGDFANVLSVGRSGAPPTQADTD